uniref:EF-hand domain-containing protein n=1 Tax=Cacopsylla melanoneura TaxID=428564 RepID=A0A8D8SCI4_9HEMI
MRCPVTLSPSIIYCTLLVMVYLTSVTSTPYKRINSEMRLRSARGFRDKVASLQTARNFGKRSSTTTGGFPEDGEMDGGLISGGQGGFGGGDTESLYNLIKENFSSDNAMADRQFPINWLVRQLTNNSYLIKLFLTEFVDTNKDGYLSTEELTSSL